jgi:hypothetical protein
MATMNKAFEELQERREDRAEGQYAKVDRLEG